MPNYILAHDLGTSGNKATLFDEKGNLIDSVTDSYDIKYYNQNWAEQSPINWWKSVCKTTKKLLESINPNLVAAVSFSGQMQGCLCVDKEGNPLGNSIIYCDQRAEKETDFLIKEIGFENIYKITGHRPSPTYSIEKLMWIKNNEPERYNKTYKILQAKDFIVFKLTGNFVTERNDASGTNAYDINNFKWAENIIKTAEIDINKFPEVILSTDIAGKVTKDAAELTGLIEGTPIIAGAGDGGCATIGAGSVSEGNAYSYIGSSAWSSLSAKKPILEPSMRVFTWVHPIDGLYQLCGTMQTAGNCYRWFIEDILKENSKLSDNELYKLMDKEASNVKPGANGLVFLPYLMGERTPWWNPKAKGSLLGITMQTGTKEIARSILEGIAMNLNYSFTEYEKVLKFSKISIIGGGARNTLLIKILSDVTNKPIEVKQYLEESTSMGAAMIGGVGCGLYGSFEKVIEMNPIKQKYKPNQNNSEFYKKLSQVFEKTYLANKEIFETLFDMN